MRFLGVGLEMKQLIQPPVLERVPNELEVPDWSLLCVATTERWTCEMFKARCQDLEENLRHAQKIVVAQEMIIEGQNAQRTVLFPGGKGRHLTNSEVIQKKREIEEEKRQEEANKEERRSAKESRRAEKERLEELWKAMLDAHTEAVAKKPKRPLKPKQTQPDGDNNDDGKEIEEDEADQDC